MNECKLYSLMATGRNDTYLYIHKTTGQLLLVSRPGGYWGTFFCRVSTQGLMSKSLFKKKKNILKMFVSRKKKKKKGTQFKRLG